jgi:hypothetical protein
MILSTHRTTHTDEPRHASIWPIALIIILSALLAVFVEPLFPHTVAVTHSEAAQTSDAQ